MERLESVELLAMSFTLAAGAIVMMWLGELIAEQGYGRGSGYIISLGILALLPSQITGNITTADAFEVGVFLFIIVLMLVATIMVIEAERRVKLMYSKRVRTGGAQESYVPLKLTQFGVMPVIFAVSVISFPQLIAQFIQAREYNDRSTEIAGNILNFLADGWVQGVGTFILVILFSFFYVTIVFNTDEMAENFQKQGAFIKGIRPGKQTAKFLKMTTYRLTAFGGVFLAILAVLPQVLLASGLISSQIFSGTGLLIIIGVLLDVRREILSQIVVRGYNRYI